MLKTNKTFIYLCSIAFFASHTHVMPDSNSSFCSTTHDKFITAEETMRECETKYEDYKRSQLLEDYFSQKHKSQAETPQLEERVIRETLCLEERTFILSLMMDFLSLKGMNILIEEMLNQNNCIDSCASDIDTFIDKSDSEGDCEMPRYEEEECEIRSEQDYEITKSEQDY